MHRRQFGNSNVKVLAIGLGCVGLSPGTTKLTRRDENLYSNSVEVSAQDVGKIVHALAKVGSQGDRYPAALKARVGR